MKTIRATGKHLEWAHPDIEKPLYELRDGDDPVATLEETSTDSAIAKTGEGAWLFRKFGYANPHVIVKREGSDTEEARFDSSETEPGLLKLSNGRQFKWEGHLWRAAWSWNDVSGQRMLTLKRDFAVAEKHEGRVEITDQGADSDHLGLLVLVGWYLVLLAAESSGDAG